MLSYKGDLFMGKNKIKKTKWFYLLYLPVLYFVGFYLFLLILSYLFTDDSLTSATLIYMSLAGAIILSFFNWLDDWVDKVSPKPRNSRQRKSLKDLKQQFLVKGTPFNKLMLMIYSLCIVIVIVIISLTVIGVL